MMEVNMKIQWLLVLFYAFNLAAVWLSSLFRLCKWYCWPGTVIFVLLPFLGVFFPQPHFELDFFWWKIAGVVAMIMGAGVIALAKMAIPKVGINLGEEPGVLVTSGLYQYVRHPMYLGLIFIYVGWWWVWAAVYSFYFGMLILALIWLQAYAEEKWELLKKFGAKFRDYKAGTGMFWIK
jgi:protein-S-isoprenylcysteine O-methyltransferase Ste14